MTLNLVHSTKRVPFAIATLLSGVVFAGFISSIIETPVGSNEYLHEHLSSSASLVKQNWAGEAFVLPIQDREKLTTIVTELEQSNWTPASDIAVTGQALTVAKTNAASIAGARVCYQKSLAQSRFV